MRFRSPDNKKKLYNTAILFLALVIVAGCIFLFVNSHQRDFFGKKSDTSDGNDMSDINDTHDVNDRDDTNDMNAINDEIVISNLRTCNLKNPIGIDEETPFFSWMMEGEGRGLFQNAYRIMVAASADELAAGEYLWDSGKVETSESVGIPYGGAALGAKSRYYWRVSVWNQDDELFASKEEAFFETGLMNEGMQGAKWISAPRNGETVKDLKTEYSESENIKAENIDAENSESKKLETGSSEIENFNANHIYTIKYDMNVTNAVASFVFGATEGRYGDMYLCQISNSDENGAAFCLRKMSGGGFVYDVEMNGVEEESEKSAKPKAGTGFRNLELGEETDITFCRVGDNSLFSVKLQVENENLLVNINGNNIGSYVIEAGPVGAVGYYKDRSTTYAYLDNILVEEGYGKQVYKEEDFEGESNIFYPYYVSVVDGRLRIESGLMLTRYYHDDAAPYFYREFEVEDKEIDSARIYMTALGSFSLVCNGQNVSDDYFAPGKFVYNQELTYVSYDVTDLLEQGKSNALGIILLHGWYDRAVGYPEISNPWGDTNAVRGMLEIHYQDGSIDTIATDEAFLCNTNGPVRDDDIYQGELYVALLEFDGFGEPGFSHNKDWHPAVVDAVDSMYYTLPLKGKVNEPVRCVKELTPISVSEPCENVFVYDFGQNFAGTCRIKVKGDRRQLVTLRYGEVLNTEDMDNRDDEIGTIWTQNLLTADATDYYMLKGAPEGESFEPEFTYHGFRYLQITGLDEALPLEDVKGIVLSSDLEQSGSFECSNELLNRYYENTVWSERSNFMDNPTDCPQRDERHGWAGDAQIFSLTASYHMNTYNFYRKYLSELRLLQSESGAFPDMAPRNFGTNQDGRGGNSGNNCWGDAAVVITWNLYVQYGNRAIIEENYEALCKWMEFLVETSDNYIRYWDGYGDHLSFESTPSELSDTAWCAHSADLISRMAEVIGRDDEAEYYRWIYENYKTAWQNAYINSALNTEANIDTNVNAGIDASVNTYSNANVDASAVGITACDTQTSYALGLAFDLFPENLKEKAAERLSVLAGYSGYHINTGYSGIGYLLPTLSEKGFDDIAYNFVLQDEYPSLLYPVKNGATTTYESLSAYAKNEDGTCHYSGSLNHYAYGTPASWLYTDVLGIKSDESAPGFHHILLQPKVNDVLTYAKGSYESPYGKIEVEWRKSDNGYDFNIVIPPNTTATFTLPEPVSGTSYLEGGKKIEGSYGVRCIDDKYTKFSLGSGSYSFTVE